MQTGTESRSVMTMRTAKAIAAGFASFVVVAGSVFGVAYLTVVYVLPRPDQWAELTLTINGMFGFLIAIAAGSLSAGYVVGRTARRAQYIHSALTAVVLAALHYICIYWRLGTLWDTFAGFWTPSPIWNSVLGAVIALFIYSPLFMLGTWLALRKQQDSKRGNRGQKPRNRGQTGRSPAFPTELASL